jgi:hypothetical protein
MNPFNRESDPDRHDIWHRLVTIDCEAFAVGDWSRIEPDFDADAFEGLRCSYSTNPDDWKIVFSTLDSYRDSWLAASNEFRVKQFANLPHGDVLLARTHLELIDIKGDRALAHKKFHGDVLTADGSLLADQRQTLYRLHKRGDTWKIVGFLGQLPLLHI